MSSSGHAWALNDGWPNEGRRTAGVDRECPRPGPRLAAGRSCRQLGQAQERPGPEPVKNTAGRKVERIVGPTLEEHGDLKSDEAGGEQVHVGLLATSHRAQAVDENCGYEAVEQH